MRTCPQCAGEHAWESCRELETWGVAEDRAILGCEATGAQPLGGALVSIPASPCYTDASQTTGPRLTDRQAAVLAALQAAGESGLEPSEAGAIAHELKEGRWAHSREQRCAYCAEAGAEVCKALERKGLARYVRGRGLWYATLDPEPQAEGYPPDFEGLRGSYNALPAGF